MGSMVGAAVVRKEDPALLTGRGSYVDDLRLPGTVVMAVVSPQPRPTALLALARLSGRRRLAWVFGCVFTRRRARIRWAIQHDARRLLRRNTAPAARLRRPWSRRALLCALFSSSSRCACCLSHVKDKLFSVPS